ncbi:hypothetical protein VNO77_05681 [Canavalia gladiata]|uniref:Uncharacterized protein n=1 Tax=Canavalia gladiata TaxID=3824 RepID=A0AAN9MYS7_CANGL
MYSHVGVELLAIDGDAALPLPFIQLQIDLVLVDVLQQLEGIDFGCMRLKVILEEMGTKSCAKSQQAELNINKRNSEEASNTPRFLLLLQEYVQRI